MTVEKSKAVIFDDNVGITEDDFEVFDPPCRKEPGIRMVEEEKTPIGTVVKVIIIITKIIITIFVILILFTMGR